MNVHTRLNNARKIILDERIHKDAINSFSNNSKFFTIDNIKRVTTKASIEAGIISIFKLIHISDTNYNATLDIINTENNESITFSIPASIPEIQKSNTMQQIGGMATYAERYLLMIAFAIADNNADLDKQETKQETKQAPQKETLTKFDNRNNITEKYKKAIAKAKINGMKLEDLTHYYIIGKETANYITEDLNS